MEHILGLTRIRTARFWGPSYMTAVGRAVVQAVGYRLLTEKSRV